MTYISKKWDALKRRFLHPISCYRELLEERRSVAILRQLINGKDVAVVGNCASLLEGDWPHIDDHEIVLRINQAWRLSDEQKKKVGFKTTAFLMSTEAFCIEEAAAAGDYIVWMTPKHRDRVYRTGIPIAYYPKSWWLQLNRELKSRPSTGCMAVDLVSRVLGDGRVSLYGFDFFKTRSWYQEAKRTNSPHQGDEEQYIRGLIPDRLKIYPPV